MGQPDIRRVGILYQTKRAAPADLATAIAASLAARGLVATCAPLGQEERLVAADPQLLVTLGGDGTVLRAARAAANCDTPIFGINFGRLGFLTECMPEEWQPHLERVLDGRCRFERRALLSVRLDEDGARGREYLAVNDVALTRGERPRAIRAHLWVDGADMGELVADGVVCATATGSTGYNLSNGGPVLPPEFRGIAVTAVAPHLSNFPPLVLDAAGEVMLQASGSGGVILTVDGQVDVPMRPDQHIHVRTADRCVTFARTRPPADFYATLRSRLRLQR